MSTRGRYAAPSASGPGGRIPSFFTGSALLSSLTMLQPIFGQNAQARHGRDNNIR